MCRQETEQIRVTCLSVTNGTLARRRSPMANRFETPCKRGPFEWDLYHEITWEEYVPMGYVLIMMSRGSLTWEMVCEDELLFCSE